jgi:hypothetical protein
LFGILVITDVFLGNITLRAATTNSRKAKTLFHHPDWLPILVADLGCGGFDQVS